MADAPAHMVGAQHWEDLLRSSMGFVGRRWNPNAPGYNMAQAVANLPNAAALMRDTFRFKLSPYFDLRRVAKTNVKMAFDQVKPVLNPVGAMLRQGTYSADHQLIEKLYPHLADSYGDSADRVLSESGLFGLFNQRHFMAYTAGQLHRVEGLDGEALKARLDRIFTYGDRTAAERTLNSVFFPFSFEKTLYRNLGGYLLDHVGQSIVLSRAMDAYAEFSHNHPDLLQRYLPIANEAMRLNAFAHGVSPGELGGINVPIANLFMPQSYASSKASQHLIGRLIPVWSDIQRI
jgi:hypothetical protein